MKNNVDYVYEYSDLNQFQTRTKILTGPYRDVVLEFGGSLLRQESDVKGGQFTFDYTLYFKPDNLNNISLRQDQEFIKFLSKLLINIIKDRRKDKKEKYKLMQAAVNHKFIDTRIKIDDRFYEGVHQ